MASEHCRAADADIIFEAPNYGTRTTSRIEWHFVTMPTAAGLDACGISEWPAERRNMGAAGGAPRVAKSLEEYEPEWRRVNERLRVVGISPLQRDEFIALRLYLGPMYWKINAAIRRVISHNPGQEVRTRDFEELGGNPYKTTIHVTSSAVVRLSKLQTRNSVVYTGFANGRLPDMFWREPEGGGPCGGTELVFRGTTPDRAVAYRYATCGGEAKRGLLLEIHTGALDSGADVQWLSQYPHEKEMLLPPLCFHEVQDIRVAKPHTTDLPVLHVTTRLRVPSVMLKPPLLTTEDEQALTKVLDDFQKDSGSHTGTCKFLGDANVLRSGQPAEAARGLAHFMQVDEAVLRAGFDRGTAAIVAEVEAHGSAELLEHLSYVLHEPASEKRFPNGVRDKGQEGKRLADFVAHPIAKQHGLDEPHVVALRLYTTAAFKYINDPLRNNERHPLPVTVAFIQDGIKKLRVAKAEGSTGSFTLWRGMRNLRVADEFLSGRQGGTELAPCSTTTDIAVAAQYSVSAESLLFKLHVQNFMQYGAELRWLSAFPSEAEVLFPPLTYLQPTGRVERISIGNGSVTFTIVEVEPHLS